MTLEGVCSLCTVEVLPDCTKMPAQASGDSVLRQCGRGESGPGWPPLAQQLPTMAARGVLMPRVTACDAQLRFHVLSSATESSSLEGAWQPRVQETNISCVHSAISSSILLLQRQLLLTSVVFTNHRALLCLKQDTCIY